MIEWAITTKDNPYSPFTQFDDWFHYDVLAEYYTCSYLDHLWQGSTDASEFDQFNSLQLAIDELVELFPELYMKVQETDYE